MKKIWLTHKPEILSAAAILLLAFFLRIYRLTLIPIFGDEAIYIRWSQIMRAEPGLRFVPLSDGKQPLFMWLVIPFLKIFSDPLFASRLFSVFSGMGTLVGIFILSYILFRSYRVSLFAALFYVISPFSIFFDRLALADSLLSFFVVWFFVFVLLTVKKMRLDAAMLAGVSLGGALLTKSPAIFFALLAPLSLFLSKWPKRYKDLFNKVCVFVFLFFFTYLIGYGMYNILRLGTNFHMIAIRNKDYVYPLTHVLNSPFDPLVVFLKDIFKYFWLLGPSVLILLVVLGIYYGWKNYKRETLILLAWGIIPILIVAEFSKTITARYVYFSMPYIFIISALSVSFYGNKIKEKVKGLNVINPKASGGELSRTGGIGSNLTFYNILLLFFIGNALIVDFLLITNPQVAPLPRSERSGYLEEWTSGYGIKEVADYMVLYEKENPQVKIVIGTEGYFGTLPDGLQLYLNNHPKITVIGVGIDLKEVPNSLKESKAAGNATFLVINNSRLKANPQELGLEIVAAYPKALRPVSTREYNLNGPQEVLYLFEIK